MTGFKPFPGLPKDYDGPKTAEAYFRLEAEWFRVQEAEAWEREQPETWFAGRSDTNVKAHRDHQLLSARVKDALEQVSGLRICASSQRLAVRSETNADGTPERLDLGRGLRTRGGDVLAWAWRYCAAGYDRRIRAALETEGVEVFGAKPDMERLRPPTNTGANSDNPANEANKEVFDRNLDAVKAGGKDAEAGRVFLRKYSERTMVLAFVAGSDLGQFIVHLDGTMLPRSVQVPGFTDVENLMLGQFLRHLGLTARRERKTVMERALGTVQGIATLRADAPTSESLLKPPALPDWPADEEDPVGRERWLSDVKIEIEQRGMRGRPV